jgi:hypothetical protein
MPWLRATAGQADRQPSSRAEHLRQRHATGAGNRDGITTTGQARAHRGKGRQAGGQASPAHGWRAVHPARGEAVGSTSSTSARVGGTAPPVQRIQHYRFGLQATGPGQRRPCMGFPATFAICCHGCCHESAEAAGRCPISEDDFIVFFGFFVVFCTPSEQRGKIRPILDDKWLAEPLGQPLTH